MANQAWRLPGRHIDYAQEAQVSQQYTGSPDRNFNDGTGWDPTQGSAREHVWTDGAACSTADPDLFQVAQKGDPSADGLSGKKLTDLNLKRFEEALTYCAVCPIRQTCLDQSTEMDRQWSVRGGELPVKVAGETRRVRAKAPTFDYSSYVPKWECDTHGIKWVSSYQKDRSAQGRGTETLYYCLECNRKS